MDLVDKINSAADRGDFMALDAVEQEIVGSVDEPARSSLLDYAFDVRLSMIGDTFAAELRKGVPRTVVVNLLEAWGIDVDRDIFTIDVEADLAEIWAEKARALGFDATVGVERAACGRHTALAVRLSYAGKLVYVVQGTC